MTPGAGPEVERTADGRHIVLGGRKWRASDPAIPEALRVELVRELMAARRAVKDSTDARPRVHDAKLALGERGEPWWEEPSEAGLAKRIEATVRALLRSRAGGSICPSEAARVVGGADWRDLMPSVREVAASMARTEEVVVTQQGAPAPADARGPIRLQGGPQLGGRAGSDGSAVSSSPGSSER